MPRRPPTSSSAYQSICKAILIVSPPLGLLVAILGFLSEEPPRGPMGHVFGFLWGQWPIWSHLFTIPAAVAVLLFVSWIIDRSAVPPGDQEVLRRTLDLQSETNSLLGGQNGVLKTLFEKLAEDHSCLAVEEGSIRDAHGKLDRDFAITWKMLDDICKMMDRIGLDALEQSNKDYISVLEICPFLGLDERAATAAIASGFHEVGAPPTEPLPWIVHHAAEQIHTIVHLASCFRVMAMAPGVFRDVITRSPGLSEAEIVEEALKHPRIAELRKSGDEAIEELARMKAELESRINRE